MDKLQSDVALHSGNTIPQPRSDALVIVSSLSDPWLACTSRLEAEVSPQLYRNWIKPLVCLGFDEGEHVLRLAAPNQFKLNWVKDQYGAQIARIAAELIDPQVRIHFVVQGVADADGAAARGFAPAEPPKAGAEPTESRATGTRERGNGLGIGNGDPAAGLRAGIDEHSRLNHELTFENFVTGKANQMARAAALQVADRPGTAYNPLFIYGGVGLGKTHLMHAVGNSVLERVPNARIRYIHAQEFFDEMVRAIQRKASEQLREAYQTLDLLLIDDIQFLANKPRTQEEFFYTFEALFAARKQIIITSDTYPKEMVGIEERLVSRFDSGLIVAIEPPELEMRMAILRRKAEQRGMALPDDVAFFVAKNLRSNVRELEGALNRLTAAASFQNKPVSMELAKDTLKDLLDLNRPQISVETIQKTVADYFKLKVADMYSKRRPANIALARQVAMYLAKEMTNKSLPEIGELFGGRDHTTVLHAVRKIAELRQHNAEMNHSLHVLEQTLRG